MHLIKSRVDQVVKHLVNLSRPGPARAFTGFQLKRKDLEGPEDSNLGCERQQVTPALNPEPELHSEQIQASPFDSEPPIMSPCTHLPSLPLICPECDEANEATAHDTDGHVRLTPTEPSDHLQNQQSYLDSIPSPTQDMVMERVDIDNGAREETQDRTFSTPVQVLTKREKNRLKSLRRKQRKKERWIQRQREEKVSW